MEEILHQIVDSLSHYLQDFYTSQVVVWEFFHQPYDCFWSWFSSNRNVQAKICGENEKGGKAGEKLWLLDESSLEIYGRERWIPKFPSQQPGISSRCDVNFHQLKKALKLKPVTVAFKKEVHYVFQDGAMNWATSRVLSVVDTMWFKVK